MCRLYTAAVFLLLERNDRWSRREIELYIWLSAGSVHRLIRYHIKWVSVLNVMILEFEIKFLGILILPSIGYIPSYMIH